MDDLSREDGLQVEVMPLALAWSTECQLCIALYDLSSMRESSVGLLHFI